MTMRWSSSEISYSLRWLVSVSLRAPKLRLRSMSHKGFSRVRALWQSEELSEAQRLRAARDSFWTKLKLSLARR